jgi:anti-anti-sigma regulatory factor
MTTRITQIDDKYGAIALLRVEGSLKLADAEVLEATFNELRKKHNGIIAIDLANTNFMDSDSASVLCRLKEQGASLLGLHFFTQRILEAVEETGK